MYLVSTGSANQYVSAARTTRNGASTSISYIYLGKVVDQTAGIYHNRKRGYFTFDLETGEFGDVPENFSDSKTSDERLLKKVSLDFGDSFLINAFLWKSGLMQVADSIGFANKDTLHAMILFYMLSPLANCNAISWFDGSIAKLLYPRANLSSQRISDFLVSIAKPERVMAFQKAYLKYIEENYASDKGILIDSSGLPNKIHIPETRTSVHNGVVSNETRLIMVVQKTTGLPLYYKSVEGNIVDVITLERILLHLDSLGVQIDSCILDAGYNSADNLDLFYNENHECTIGFITRVRSSDKRFKKMIEDELPTLDDKENLIQYKDRYVFLKKAPVMTGSNGDNPAWLYLGMDIARGSDEVRKLMKRAVKNNLSDEEVFNAMQTQGLFGILSGKDYPTEEILPAYYQRQEAEQIFDIAKNYTRLLPLRVNDEKTYEGHLLLSFIATAAVKMIQLKLKAKDMFLGSKFACLRNLKCTVYKNRIVTDPPQKDARLTFEALGLTCPVSIPIIAGELQYSNQGPEAEKEKNPIDKGTDRKKAAGRGPGRPKGSKNKKTLERELTEGTVVKRPRGRPKGSKNKKTLEKEALARDLEQPKRKRGRPKGSKNKVKGNNQGITN